MRFSGATRDRDAAVRAFLAGTAPICLIGLGAEGPLALTEDDLAASFRPLGAPR